MRPRSADLALIALLLVAVGVHPTRADQQPAYRAAQYLIGGQHASGAFYGEGARADSVLEAAAAVAAAGGDARSIERAADYAAARASGSTRGGHFGRSAIALITLNRDPRSFGGIDHIASIRARRDPATGAYDPNVYGHAIAMLGLLAAGADPDASSVRYLELGQCADGGFSSAVGCTQPSDADTTGVAVNVLKLLGHGPNSAAVQRAVGFLKESQNDDGGWPNGMTSASNPNSTALAIVGIVSAGLDPSDPTWSPSGKGPLQALASMQGEDGGFIFAGRSNAYATVQAINGLLASPFPLTSRVGGSATTRPEWVGSREGADTADPSSARVSQPTTVSGSTEDAGQGAVGANFRDPPRTPGRLVASSDADHRRPWPLIYLALVSVLLVSGLRIWWWRR